MNYISISFITTIVLYYLLQLNMQSSRQSQTFRLAVEFTHTEMNLETPSNFTMAADLAGWIGDITIKADVEDMSHESASGVMVTTSDDWGEVDDLNPYQEHVMIGWANVDQAASLMSHSNPRYFFLQPNAVLGDNTAYSEERKFNLYEEVQKGDNINIHFFHNTLDNTLTTGFARFVIIFVFIIGCFAHKSRGSNIRGSEVAIIAYMDTSSDDLFWSPPSNGRVGNIRLTIFNNLQSPEDYLYFGKQMHTDSEPNQDEIYKTGNGLYVTAFTTDTGDPYLRYGATNYQQKPMFLKKGELLHLQLQGNIAKVLVEFSFIPDFDHHVDFNIRWNVDNIVDDTAELKVFQIPFDMYIEKLNFSARTNASLEGEIYIMGLKSLPEVLSTATIHAGSLVGTSGIQNQQSAVIPSNILEILTMAKNENLYENEDIEVFDYYHAGSFIMVIIDSEVAAGTEDLDMNLNISGKSRVKSSRFGTNYFIAEGILNNEALS